jgi:hypothetical protein
MRSGNIYLLKKHFLRQPVFFSHRFMNKRQQWRFFKKEENGKHSPHPHSPHDGNCCRFRDPGKSGWRRVHCRAAAQLASNDGSDGFLCTGSGGRSAGDSCSSTGANASPRT